MVRYSIYVVTWNSGLKNTQNVGASEVMLLVPGKYLRVPTGSTYLVCNDWPKVVGRIIIQFSYLIVLCPQLSITVSDIQWVMCSSEWAPMRSPLPLIRCCGNTGPVPKIAKHGRNILAVFTAIKIDKSLGDGLRIGGLADPSCGPRYIPGNPTDAEISRSGLLLLTSGGCQTLTISAAQLLRFEY